MVCQIYCLRKLGVSNYLACITNHLDLSTSSEDFTQLGFVPSTELCKQDPRNPTEIGVTGKSNQSVWDGSCSWKKERNGHLFPSLVSNQKQIVVTNFSTVVTRRDGDLFGGKGGSGEGGIEGLEEICRCN